jgi:hypothetical protein
MEPSSHVTTHLLTHASVWETVREKQELLVLPSTEFLVVEIFMHVCVCLVHAEIDSVLNSTSTVHFCRLWLLLWLAIPRLWFL